MGKTRVIVADDHILFRSALRKLLESKSGIRVVGECASGKDTLSLIQKKKPDVLLMDAQLPDLSGPKLLKQLRSSPDTRVILLTGNLESIHIAHALRSSARGIVLKDAATECIFNSIDAVISGLYWIYTAAVPELDEALTLPPPEKTGLGPELPQFNLTQREVEILRAIASGYSNKTIASQLSISEQTVKHHVTNIFNKTGASNRLELTLFAIEHKVIGMNLRIPGKGASDAD